MAAPARDFKLNPRRAQNAERLLHFINFNGGKLILNRSMLARIKAAVNMGGWAVDNAIDDLFTMGVVVNRTIGEIQVVEVVNQRGII